MSSFKKVAEDANPLFKAWNDIKDAELDTAEWINDQLGINSKRSKPNLVTPEKPNKYQKISESTKKRVTRKFTGDPKHRAINSGVHGDEPITQSTMSNQQGAGGAADGDVQVVPIPRQIAKSHPDYFTIKLPIYATFTQTLTENTSIAHYWLRLNSVFDPFVGGTADLYQPFGRDTWGAIYDYYRVVSCDVNLIFDYRQGKFGSNETTSSPYDYDGRCAHALVGYAISDDTTDKHANGRAFVEGKHTKAAHLFPTNFEVAATSTAGGSTPSDVTRMFCYGGNTAMSFHYAPENWDYHVQQTGIETRWTAQGANPTNPHYMGIVMAYPQNDGTLDSDDEIKIGCTAYVNYTVQWREVNSTKKRTVDTAQ